MSRNYRNLLAPIKIGNVVIKNRFLATKGYPAFIQGPETYPSEALISWWEHLARNGAAIVSIREAEGIHPREAGFLPGHGVLEDHAHGAQWDICDYSVQNYFSQAADSIHYYSALACIGIFPGMPAGYSFSSFGPDDFTGYKGHYLIFGESKEAPKEMLEAAKEDIVKRCLLYKSLGFDMCGIYMPYKAGPLAISLSPVLNKRKDEYGGSLENRAKYAGEIFAAIKKSCGRNFLIEIEISGEEEDGYSVEDFVEYCRIWQDNLDIVQIKGWDADSAHPTGFNSIEDEPVTLKYAEALKRSGVNVIVAPNGGYQAPELADRWIEEGKMDMVAAMRPFFADFRYAEKMYAGRGDQIVPCIRCNKCHGPFKGPWVSTCSVNPEAGLVHRIKKMVDQPRESRRVVVIGGGPAGMRAAMECALRGHKVTLFEKADKLGGLLTHTDYFPFKWPLKNFKNFLTRQLDELGVEVYLNTMATPELISAGDYYAVIAAVGSVPRTLQIPGAGGENVVFAEQVWGHEDRIGNRVVVIGGGEVGTETAMYLAGLGKTVKVIEMADALVPEAPPMHYREIMESAWEKLETFSYVTGAVCSEIKSGSVEYVKEGKMDSVPADTVVVAVGYSPKSEEVMKFSGLGNKFFYIGDCRQIGDIQKCNRTAYAAASEIC